MAVVDRIDEIGPLFRLGQLVRREIAGVPHDPVPGERLAEVETLRIVDRIVADLRRHRGVLRVRFCSSFDDASTSNASGAEAQKISGRLPTGCSRTNAMPAAVFLFRISSLSFGYFASKAFL